MKAPRKLRFVCVTLVVLCLSPVAAAQTESTDQTSLDALIKAYYEAYAQGDLGALVRLWSLRSPDLVAGIKETQRALSAQHYQFSDLATSRTRISGNKAILQVTGNVTITNIQTNAGRQERYARNFALIKDAGEWKVWRDAPASEDLSAFLIDGSEWKVSADSIEQFAKELVNASETLLKKEAGKFNVIHLAAPAVLSDASPLFSHVALSQSEENGSDDGLLEARELMKLDLDADLTVMSSSEIAKDVYSTGDAIHALAWSLFVAGCPASIVSRWSANSPSTTELMLEFYKSMQAPRSRLGSSKSQALRRAMIKLVRGNYRHPFYWAGFTLVGDFR